MNKRLPVLFIIILVGLLLVSGAERCVAQSVKDTISNSKTDTARQKIGVTDTAENPAVTTFVDKDSLAYALKPHPYQPNPKKAGLYAAILPGLGQIYNRQYWKIPIVYAGLGVAGYFIESNLSEYRRFRKAYVSRLGNPNYVDEFTPQKVDITYLKQYQDDYDKNLSLSVLFTTLGYFLQVLDAITSAHLKNFDMSRDISMHVQPVATPNGLVGLGLVMNFK